MASETADAIHQIVSTSDDAKPKARVAAAPRAHTATDQGTEVDEQFGALQKLGLLVEVEFDFQSEVLGFGPHAGFANTRQAPFVELAIRAKPPRKRRRDKRAFMAQIDIPGLPQDRFGVWWDQSKANRASRVGADHDDRAKARVTFAIPAWSWKEEA